MVETDAEKSLLMRHLEMVAQAATARLGVSDPSEARRIKETIYKAINHPEKTRGPVIVRGRYQLQIHED